MWLATLSGQLPVVALVGRHPANELIGREPLAPPRRFPSPRMPGEKRMRYYPAVGPAIPRGAAGRSRVTHPFAGCVSRHPRDLHVLSTPPAFVLSQDQTLQEKNLKALRNKDCHDGPKTVRQPVRITYE
jgi:hypothetical protein